MPAKEAGQADPIRTAPLHGEGVHWTERTGPSQQFGVALVGGVDEQWFAEASPEAVEGDRDVLVLMGVDADDDVVAFKRDAGHGC
jgi:hypothetical protein